MNEAEMMELCFGTPGTPVPEVDSADIRAIYEYGREMRKEHPEGSSVFTSMEIFESICKPGSNVKAVFYRTMKLGTLSHIVSSFFPAALPLLEENPEAAYAVTATMPLLWESRSSFDVEDYLRRIEKAS